MSLQIFTFSKNDLEKAVEIILKKATSFSPSQPMKGDDQPDDLISQQEACVYLRISTPTIISWKKKGLPFYNFHGRFFFSKKELLEFGRRGPTNAPKGTKVILNKNER